MIIHVVEQGDTIPSIAETYQVPITRLIQENGLKEYNNLVIGQTIVIVHTDKIYIVQEGDTLMGIAHKNDITLLELLRNNPRLSSNPNIFAGDILVISYDEKKQGKMSTNGYTFPFIQRDILKTTLPFLTYLTIYEYRVTCEGELIGIEDEEIIQIAKSYGVAPLMLITTLVDVGSDGIQVDFSIIENKEIQEHFINNVLEVLEAKGYYGLNIFIQYFNLEYQTKVEEFIKNLSERLQSEGYPIIATLTPRTVVDESYDNINYSIFEEATDGVLLLSYEWGYSSGPPIAATSVPLVREYLDFGVTQISPENIRIGIPVIAYNWELPYVEGVTTGNSLSMDSALQLASDNNAIIQFDEVAKAPYFFYEVGLPDMKTLYVVWFKDARSIDVLTSLVPEFGLGGIAIWNIMNFLPQLWLIINTRYEIEKVLSSINKE